MNVIHGGDGICRKKNMQRAQAKRFLIVEALYNDGKIFYEEKEKCKEKFIECR